MNKFQKVKRIIENYQRKADKCFASYREKEAEARKTYSTEGFRDNFMQGTWVQMASEIWSKADLAILEANNILDEAQEDFNKWVMTPLNAETTQVLNCINQFGLRLSLDELRVLEQNVRDSYFGCRIFQGLCEQNGYGINTPEMRIYVDTLKNAREEVRFAIQAYAGSAPDFAGRDLLQKWEYNGVVYGEYEDFHLVMAESFLNKGCILDRLENLWESVNAPMAYTLNASETEKMKTELEKIVDKDGKVNGKAAQQLEKNDPDFTNKLRSMPEGSFENMEAVSKYFRLDDEKENKKGESVLSPSMEQAALYASSHAPADLKLLDQYK